MRVSPVAYAFDTAEAVLAEAERSAAVTHDHAEGIRGAQATALATFRARTGVPKPAIRRELMERFGYALDRTLDAIRPTYRFDVSCQGSVPEALIAFLDAPDAIGAIRGAISLGGDADTQAAIAGAAGTAFDGGLPTDVEAEVRARLPADMLAVLESFEVRFPTRRPVA
jgi:ADP-ribosylglycohydrolase